jgi:hypothetical protein
VSACLRIPNGILTVGGSDFAIMVRDRRWVFEWNEYLGPMLLGARGQPLAFQPGYALEAISLWAQQGKIVSDGLCVWAKEPEPILLHVAGRHWIAVGPSGQPPRLPEGVSYCPGCSKCKPDLIEPQGMGPAATEE